MARTIPYDLKGTLRSDYVLDKARLENFRALECDWREIFRWIVSVAEDMPLYNEDFKVIDMEKDNMAQLWHDHVLTVLVEMQQKNLRDYAITYVDGNGTAMQQRYTDDLRHKIERWDERLRAYISHSQVYTGGSPAVKVAETLQKQLSDSLHVASGPTHRHRLRASDNDDKNRPFFTMLGVLIDIQSKFDYYMEQIFSSGDMDASQALLLTFTRSYCNIIRQFNDKFAQLPEFYRREILEAKPQAAIQDSTYLVLTPNKEIAGSTFALNEGVRFPAGETSDGSPLYYALDERSYIIPATIRSAHTVFGKDAEMIRCAVPLDGSAATPLFSVSSPDNAPLEYGWLVSSHILSLAEGERNVNIHFNISGRADIAERLCAEECFALLMSGSEGWKEYPVSIAVNAAESLLTFSFVIEEGEEAPAVCQKEIHGIDTDYPAAKIVARKVPAVDEIEALTFDDIHFSVKVSGCRTFSIYGNVGEMDSTRPFYPFGTVGEKGSWFIFGSEEMSIKEIMSVSLKGTWNKLPDGGFAQLYRNYSLERPVDDASFKVECQWQENSRWNTCGNSPQQVFATDASGKAMEDAEFNLIIADDPNLLHATSFAYSRKSSGFYRIRLIEPGIGFGMATYRQQYAEVMMHNSREKERRHKAVPSMPQVPMLADVMLDYTAVGSLSRSQGTDMLFRITETDGYMPVAADGSAVRLLPKMGSSRVYICLDEVAGINRLKMYVNIGYSGKGLGIISSDEMGTSIVEYLTGNDSWKAFPSDCLIADETAGLTRSGFIEIKTVDEFNRPIVSGDGVWIRIGFSGERPPRNTIINGIYLNCLKVTAQNGDGTPSEAETIGSMEVEDPRIAQVWQPMPGYGGKIAERPEDISVRISTRMATRNRALNMSDYERMILERFDDIEKICCIPSDESHREIHLVVFPKPEKRRLPQLPNWKLSEIEQYIKGYISPFAKVRVMNPAYEPLTIAFSAILKDSVLDRGEVQRRLTRRIYRYFIPWLWGGELPELGKRFSYEALKSWLVNDEGLELSVSFTIDGGRRTEETDASGEVTDVYYTGSMDSCILYPAKIDIELNKQGEGIGDSSIGENFIIG